MKVVMNSLVPFKGFKAMFLFGILFVRNDLKHGLEEKDYNHEAIHGRQCLEMLGVFFYLWYVLEWLVRIPFNCFNVRKAYRNVSFEREAYGNERNKEYLSTRKMWSWIRYI